jgi:hypothetical protein
MVPDPFILEAFTGQPAGDPTRPVHAAGADWPAVRLSNRPSGFHVLASTVVTGGYPCLQAVRTANNEATGEAFGVWKEDLRKFRLCITGISYRNHRPRQLICLSLYMFHP